MFSAIGKTVVVIAATVIGTALGATAGIALVIKVAR